MKDPISGTKKLVGLNVFKSFFYAFRGILYAFSFELNLTFQVFIGVSTTLLFIGNNKITYAIISLVMMFVVGGLELMNTAFEHLCDLVDQNYNPVIKRIKDVAAGAVLYAAVGWATVIVFGLSQIIFNYRI